MNIKMTKRGFTGFKNVMDMFIDNNIYGRWQIHGDNTAKYVVKRIIQKRCTYVASVAVLNLFSLNFKALSRNLKEGAHRHFYFWVVFFKNMILFIPNLFFKQLIRRPMVIIAKTLIRFINEVMPSIKYKSDLINRLTAKAYK